MSRTDQIYDCYLTVISRLLIEQEEVKVDLVGVLGRVRVSEDATEGDKIEIL